MGRSISIPDPDEFGRAWFAAFNAHDLEAVLEHFHDDVVFTSPVAARALPDTEGLVHGKDALRACWTLALQRVPDLHFELLGVYTGIDTLVLHYRNQTGGLVNEVLVFDGTLIRQGHGTYLSPSAHASHGTTSQATESHPPSETTGYWTPERRRNSTPAPMPRHRPGVLDDQPCSTGAAAEADYLDRVDPSVFNTPGGSILVDSDDLGSTVTIGQRKDVGALLGRRLRARKVAVRVMVGPRGR